MAGATTGSQVELQKALKQQIHKHLDERGVFSDLKQIVSTVLGGGGDAALDAAGQSAMISQIVGSSARTPPPPDPSRSHLHVTLLGGRAFPDVDSITFDSMEGAAPKEAKVMAGLAFGSQRFRSAPVQLCAEPKFAGAFLVELPRLERPTEGGSSRALDLLAVEEMLHLVVVEQHADGSQHLASSLLVDWRKVLHSGSCILSLQLPGIGEDAKLPAGAIEMRLELRPFLPPAERVSEADLVLEIKRQRARQTDQERR